MEMLREKVDFQRFAHAVYCDDIRQERNGKEIWIGVYSDVILVPAFPVVLPSFVVKIGAKTAAQQPFKSLQFFLFRDDEVLVSHEIDSSVLAANNKALLHRQSLIKSPGAGQPVAGHVIEFRFSPFEVEAPCQLKARVMADGSQLLAGGISIITRDEYESRRNATTDIDLE